MLSLAGELYRDFFILLFFYYVRVSPTPEKMLKYHTRYSFFVPTEKSKAFFFLSSMISLPLEKCCCIESPPPRPFYQVPSTSGPRQGHARTRHGKQKQGNARRKDRRWRSRRWLDRRDRPGWRNRRQSQEKLEAWVARRAWGGSGGRGRGNLEEAAAGLVPWTVHGGAGHR